MMKQNVLLMLAGFTLVALGMMPEVHARTLDCASNDNRLHRCLADTRGGVQLIRQYSRARCIEGRSWGYDHRGIWVSHGCRARFHVAEVHGYPPPPASPHHRGPEYRQEGRHHELRTVQCESWGSRTSYCRTPPGIRHVRLIRQLSNRPCRHGYTWGWDAGRIWVKKGCRAVFALEH